MIKIRKDHLIGLCEIQTLIRLIILYKGFRLSLRECESRIQAFNVFAKVFGLSSMSLSFLKSEIPNRISTLEFLTD